MDLGEWGATLGASPVALAIFLVTIVTSILAFEMTDLYRAFVLHPYSLVRERRYYTLLTSGLIHADPMHLIFNMLTFYFFAFALEREIGHWQFLVLYALSLALSDLSTVYKNRNRSDYYSLGASGAITAVLFSSIVYNPLSGIYMLPIPIAIPAPIFAIFYVAYSYYSARYRDTHINHSAHLWGAICGLALTLILDPEAYLRLLDLITQRFSIGH